jgi:hypothetical protein
MSAPHTYTRQGFEPENVQSYRPEPYTTELEWGGRMASPTDEQYEALRRKVHRAMRMFIPIYGLQRWQINVAFYRNYFTGENENAAMWVESNWEYQHMTVHVSVASCYDDAWSEIKYKIAHELAHPLIEPLLEHVTDRKDKHVRHALELLTHTIALSVIFAVNADGDIDEEDAPTVESETP